MGEAQRLYPNAGSENAAREARVVVVLAAAFRPAARLNVHEGVCNHLTLKLPGSSERFLLNRFGLHRSEVAASNLLLLDAGGRVRARDEPDYAG